MNVQNNHLAQRGRGMFICQVHGDSSKIRLTFLGHLWGLKNTGNILKGQSNLEPWRYQSHMVSSRGERKTYNVRWADIGHEVSCDVTPIRQLVVHPVKSSLVHIGLDKAIWRPLHIYCMWQREREWERERGMHTQTNKERRETDKQRREPEMERERERGESEAVLYYNEQCYSNHRLKPRNSSHSWKCYKSEPSFHDLWHVFIFCTRSSLN